MDCRKTKRGAAAVPCLPDDSLLEILSRLPAKPLFRFKCVSKAWRDLIAAHLGCRKFPQTLEGFLTRGSSAENKGDFIDLSGRPVPLMDPSFAFLTKSPGIKKIVLLGSCNGLVLFGHRQGSDGYDSLGYIVCNPATEEWVSVPRPFCHPQDYSDDEDDQDDNRSKTYLMFDPAVSPHFRLIQLRFGYFSYLQEVYTFSSVTGAWRPEPGGVPRHTRVSIGVCSFNGMLHMGAHRPRLPCEKRNIMMHAIGRACEKQNIILAVGGEGRSFRTLHWPQNDHGLLVFVSQSQGRLHCLSGCKTEDSEMTELSIWVLEDYNAEEWVLRDNVSPSQLFGRMKGRLTLDWNVVGIHPDCGLVFFAEYWNHKLISYNMDKKEVCAICSLDDDCRLLAVPYVPYFAQSAVLAKKH